ncbi:MAG: hypothetical protein ABSF11_06360 [Methylocella sp.]
MAFCATCEICSDRAISLLHIALSRWLNHQLSFRARNFLPSTNALASGALRGLELATGVAAGAALAPAPAAAFACQALGGGGGAIDDGYALATACGP